MDPSGAKTDESFTNILYNLTEPFNGTDSILSGSAVTITSEVFVSYLIRWFMKAPKPLMSLAFIHALSLPFMGGIGPALLSDEPAKPFDNSLKDKDNTFTAQLMKGAYGIPAVLLAQWIVETSSIGFHLPWFNMKDLFITAAAKAVTAPLLWTIHDYMPFIVQNGLQSNDILQEYQALRSRFTSATTKRGQPQPFTELKKA